MRQFVLVVVLLAAASMALAAPVYTLKGVSQMSVCYRGDTVVASTLDGTPAATKVEVGRIYTLFSTYQGRSRAIAKVVVTLVRDTVAIAKVVVVID